MYLQVISILCILYTQAQARSQRAGAAEQDAAKEFHWNYEEAGPDVWPKHFPICKGPRQSPIDIRSGDIEVGFVKPLKFANYDLVLTNLTIKNNGHTVQVDIVSDSNSKPHIEQGGLGAKYNLIQFHFHWAQSNSEGSETFIHGEQYPLELHLVHLKEGVAAADLGTTSESLAVLGVLFEVRPENLPGSRHEILPQQVIDGISRVKSGSGVSSYVSKLRIQDLLPKGVDTFYRYSGSLTTPPCSEVVQWTVFPEPLLVTEKQLQVLREVKSSPGNVLQKNFRPVQKVNGRKVLFRIGPSASSADFGRLIPRSMVQYRPSLANNSKVFGKFSRSILTKFLNTLDKTRA